MFISSLQVDSFKNLAPQTISLEPKAGINILLGENGQGKTNLLEAVRFLALPKPLRSRRLVDCTQDEGNHFRIIGDLAEAKASRLEFGFQANPMKRLYKLNDGETGIKNFLGNLHVVLFTPDDLNMLTGAPSLRRRFLDSLLAQLFPEYFEALSHYYHALRQRNALLKQIYNKPNLRAELPVWNQKLAEPMLIVTQQRLNFMNLCRQEITNTYQDLAEADDEIKLDYNWGLDIEEPSLPAILDKLIASESDDIRYGYTSFGPHRDDFTVMINSKPAKIVASRGELRSIVLSLKILELQYFHEAAESFPLFLLDDVFSELDETRRQKLLIQSKKYQTLITTVEKSYFAGSDQPIALFNVNAGRIEPNVV